VSVVVLVGFMGAGKTSVGRALAQHLNCIFEDLDDRIVGREKRSVAEIFRDSGERGFRNAEHAALREVMAELSSVMTKIVALGGGAFTRKRNADLLRSAQVCTVFLDAPVEELWSRCRQQAAANGAERPLLNSMNQFRKLYDSRRGAYLQSSMIVQTAGRSVDAIASEIAQILGLPRAAGNRRVQAETGEIE
jgi:shikimate kinase